MGSDMHGYSPSPPEHRVVTNGEFTALYSRDTDLIYGHERCNTWTTKKFYEDSSGTTAEVLLDTLVSRTKGLVILNEALAYEFPREKLEQTERDWDREERKLTSDAERAQAAVLRESKRFNDALEALDKFRNEKGGKHL